MAATNFAAISADAVTYIREELLDLAEKLTVFAQFADMVQLPQHNSKTIQFSRYPYLPLPQTPTADGVTPADQALSVQTVTATTDQWMLTVTLTDLAQLTIKHPLVPIVNDLLGYAMAQLVDREHYNVLVSGATVVFPGSVASRSALTAGNVMDDVTMMKVSATLRNLGARPHDGSSYILIVDAFTEQDIINQTSTFLAAHQFKAVESLYNSEVGRWRGYRVVRSNLIPVIALIGDGAWTAAASVGGGSLTVGTYTVKLTATSNQFGFEEQISNSKDVVIAGPTDKVAVTAPSTAGFTYNIYFTEVIGAGQPDSKLHLVIRGLAPSSVTNVTTLQATGANPPASPPSGVNVHTSFAIGRQYFSCVKLSGDNMRVLVTDQRASDSDPGAQRRKLSFKGSFKVVILNQDFGRRIETASAFG